MSAAPPARNRRRYRAGTRPRALPDAERTRAYSRFVRRMKIGLVAGSALLLAALLLLSGTLDGPAELDITFTELTTLNDDLRMVSPRISDVDDAGRPYTLTAATAIQDKDDPALIHLEEVQGDMEGGGGSWSAVSARTGRLNTDEEWLDLEGDVMLFTDDGYQFAGDLVRIDLASGDISSDRPVTGQGPAGTIEGGGVRITNSGDDIKVINGSKLVIFDVAGSFSGDAAAAPAAEAASDTKPPAENAPPEGGRGNG